MPVDDGAPGASEAVRDQVRDRRMLVLFFDLTSMETDDITPRARRRRKFLKQQMTPADLVSVVVFSTQLSVLANFTNDRAMLDKAIAQLIPGAARKSPITLYAAAQNGEYDVQQDTGAAYTPDRNRIQRVQHRPEARAIEGLANVLAGIPGRKALVEFTGGITQTGEENRAELRAATDAANRADVSIYSIDARGMFATPPGGDVTTDAATGTSMFTGASVFHQTDQREDSRDTLATLSTDTGGTRLLRSRRPERRLPENSAGQQRLLPGRLLSPARREARRQLARRPREGQRARRARPLSQRLLRAARFPASRKGRPRPAARGRASNRRNPVVELPIAVETAMFRLSDQQVYVPISAKLSSSALDWAQKHGRRQAEFDFAAEVRAVPSGQIVAQLRDTITVHLDEQRFQQVHQQQSGVSGRRGARARRLPAEIRRARKRIRKNRHIRAGPRGAAAPARAHDAQLRAAFEPARARGENSPRCRPKGRACARRSPRRRSKWRASKIVPSVTRFFTQQQTLYVFFQAYYPEKGGKAEAFDANTLRAGLVFFRGGVQVNATPLLAPTAVDPKTHTASFRISLPLAKLPTGATPCRPS